MQTQPTPAYRFEDYLAVERESIEVKHEYVAGVVFAMTGGSYEHSLIAANVTRRLGNQLDGGPCRVLTSDMRIRIETADVCAYPDVSVLCGEPAFHDERRDVLTNPVLIAQDRVSVDVFTRQPGDRWLLSADADLDAVIELETPDCRLSVREIYDQVVFGASEDGLSPDDEVTA